MSGIGLLLIIIAISSLPVMAVYVWFRIAGYQFSAVRYLIVLLVGAVTFFPALILQNVLLPLRPAGGRAELFYEFFFRIAFTEEFSRLLILIIFFMVNSFVNQKHITEGKSPLSWYDVKKSTATGLIAGFGFAILESVRYAADNMDIRFLLIRTVTAAPIHAACGARVGSAAAMIRVNPVQSTVRLLTATAIHGIYNLMVITPGIIPSIAAILIAFTALASSILTIRGGWANEHRTP